MKVRPGALSGRKPLRLHIRERTGCTIVAVERGDEIVMDFSEDFTLTPDDALYLCGTTDAINRYYESFPRWTREEVASRRFGREDVDVR